MDSHIKLYYAKNLDSWGLITKNGDGGDTCSRHFTALYCMPHTIQDVEPALELLQIDGIPRRHPDTSKWYWPTNTTSRDQLIPYLCFVATPSKAAPKLVRSHFLKLVSQHAKRLFLFTWNTKRNFRYPTLEEHQAKSTPDVKWDYSSKLPDFCGPNIWAVYLRGLMQYNCLPKTAKGFAYALLHVLDMHKLLDASITALQHYILKQQFGPTRIASNLDHDCQNAALTIHYSAHNIPTVISWLTWKLYKPMAQKAAESFFQQDKEPRLDIAIHMLD